MLRQMDGGVCQYIGAYLEGGKLEGGGTLIGSILASHDNRRGWINRLAVHPEHRHKEVGQALMKAAEVWLGSVGIRIFAVLVETWNEPSLAFFKDAGYLLHDDIVYFSKREGPEV